MKKKDIASGIGSGSGHDTNSNINTKTNTSSSHHIYSRNSHKHKKNTNNKSDNSNKNKLCTQLHVTNIWKDAQIRSGTSKIASNRVAGRSVHCTHVMQMYVRIFGVFLTVDWNRFATCLRTKSKRQSSQSKDMDRNEIAKMLILFWYHNDSKNNFKGSGGRVQLAETRRESQSSATIRAKTRKT